MRIYRSYYILLFIFIFSLQIGDAQQMLNGVVKDEQGKPVASANVILQLNEKGPIISFAITNENGEFSVKRPPNADSAFIMITHLSYAKKEFYIHSSLPFLEIELSAQQYKLPELVVKTEPVTRRGDTLIFNISSYREDSDQNLEQVLNKIPGITVESNGSIKYDGLDISKFYIEGLDMLEGRYKIVTRNLNIDAIRDIEIIEHHQPIRALDSLVRPDNAAINLRLKSNVAITGSLRGGTGASPALYLAGGDVFGFTKKQQFNILASANNIGENQRNNFQNLYANYNVSAPELISVNQVLPPFLMKQNYYLDNQELTGGYNYLKKLSTYTEFKWQGFAQRDRVRNIGARTLRYQDGENNVIFEEILKASEQPLDFNNRVIIEHNAKKIFFRTDVNTEWNIIKSTAENKVNGIAYPENLMKHNFNGIAELTAIFRRKNKAYQLNSDIEYKTTDHDLTLMPVDIFTPDFPATRFPEALQIARQKEFKVNTYSNLFFKTKQINGQVNMGVNYHHNTLNTDLLTQSDTTENKSLGRAFQNDNSISEFAPYINQTYRKEYHNTRWTLSIPLSAHLFNIYNKVDQNRNLFNILVARPKLEYNLRLPKGNNLNAAYAFYYDYDRFQTLFYEGYIIRSNRNITTSVFDINRYQKHELYTRFSGQNFEKNSHYALTATLSETAYDFISSSSFNQLGLTSNVIERKNNVRRLSLQGDISGPLGHNLNAEFRAAYSVSARPGILNGRNVNIQNHFITINPRFYYTFTQSILSLKPGFQVFSNNFSGTPAYQLNAEVVYFIKINTVSSLRMSYNQYLTAVGGRNVWNEFFTMEYKYTLKKLKADLLLNINNLTNNTHYINFMQNAFSEDLSSYRLRPRQMTFSFVKKF